TPRNSPAAVELLDGRIAVIGGSTTPTMDLYDPAAHAWTTFPTPTFGQKVVATRLAGRDVLGFNNNNTSAPPLHVATGTWVNNMPAVPFLIVSLILTPQGALGTGYATETALFDATNNVWTQGATLTMPAATLLAMFSNQGRALGMSGYGAVVYDPLTQ